MDKILEMKCIKYGSNKFDKSKFLPIKNRNWIKPDGGLWASPVKTKYGWKQWCEGEQFHIEKLSIYFTFTFKGKAFVINGIKDSKQLPWKLRPGYSLNSDLSFLFSNFIDFELLSKKYDGIFLTAKGEAETRFAKKYSLYGWDCESILILNSKSIFPYKESINPLLRAIDLNTASEFVA